MNPPQALPASLQENVLCLLCFKDDAALVISGLISPSLFDNAIYRRVAALATDYVRKYRKSPQIHIADLLEEDLNKKGKSSNLLSRVLQDLKELYEDGVNEEFVLNNLKGFIRQQRLKAGVVEAASLLQEGQLDKAESKILEALKDKEAAFSPGINLRSGLSLVEAGADVFDTFKIGIPPFDAHNIGPSRKALFLLMAATNKGKSWGLVHIGKFAILQRLKVLHITLEMSEARLLPRYYQSMFSMFRRGDQEIGKTDIVMLDKSPEGIFEGYSEGKVLKRPVLTGTVGMAKAKKLLSKLGNKVNLLVKEFPTGALTMEGLRAYLDMLEHYDRFVPDMLIIDYPDLMSIDTSQLRVDTGRMYKQLRGLGVERNMAVVAVTQTNRGGEDAKLIGLRHTSEDYSKAATADTVITYNQTSMEKVLGLARLFVAKERDERSGLTAIISQSYALGQFHLDSALVGAEEYRGYIRSLAKHDADDS